MVGLFFVGLDAVPEAVFVLPITYMSVLVCNTVLNSFVADGWAGIAQLGAIIGCTAYLTVATEAGIVGALIGGVFAYLKRDTA